MREWKKGDRGVIAYMYQGKIRIFDPVLKKDVTPPTREEEEQAARQAQREIDLMLAEKKREEKKLQEELEKKFEEQVLEEKKEELPKWRNTPRGDFSCSKCDFVTPNKSTMKTHFRRSHSELLDGQISTKSLEETAHPDGKLFDASEDPDDASEDPWHVDTV